MDQKIPVTLIVVTPLFLGNAYQQSELRPPSLKGVLRFWHRAMGPDNLNTEEEYFGSTEGQSSFLLQAKKLPESGLSKECWNNNLNYLGYGLKQKGCSRQYIEPGKKLEFSLVFRPDASPEAREAVFRSFRLLSLFGGLGSRSRRGFGSVNLVNNMPNSVQELILQIKSELTQCNLQKEINYTAFCQSSRIVIPFVETSWESALQRIEEAIKKYRSTDMFARDRDLIGTYLNSGSIGEAPQRVSFGLPHNYFFKDTHKSATVAPDNEKKYSRRASPLFIHIHQLLNKECVVIVSFLPAPLLPQGELLKVVDTTKGVQFRQETQTVKATDECRVVENFLNYLLNLPGAQEVKWQS